MTDSLTDVLADALLRWEDAKRSGTNLTPQDLCSDRPEIWPDLIRIISTSPIVEELLDTSRDSKSYLVGPAPPPEIPGYEIERILGKGAMSVVYLARHVHLRRRVALKVLRVVASLDDEEQIRFRSEIKANARLQHPNVVQIYEAGEHGSSSFLALEYVEGGSLREKLADGPLPPGAAAELVRVLAEALQEAHSAGIVHRDLKPANVLLTSTGQPKIADFGLAKLRKLDEADTVRAGATQSGAILGTPTYMAPERAAGKTSEVGAAADIYALGAILYECLTGRPPFQAASIIDLLDLIRREDPASPRMLQPRLPADLETICLKCLSKDAARRYESAQELAEDIRRFQMGVPIRARPVGWLERAWKFTRRNAVLVGGIAATMLALTVGLVGVAFAYAEQQRAQKRAENAEKERRRADAESFVQLAKVQMLSGRWPEALYWLDRALAAGVDDPLAVRFLRCQTLLALNRPESAEELNLLERHASDRPELVAQVQLWRGDMVLGRDDEQAEKLLRASYASGKLDDVDRAYVEGVLAENSAQLIDRLEYVVQRQPNRLRANLLLGFTYLSLGRREEGKLAAERIQTLHPDDSFVAVLHALIAALEMRPAEVDRHLVRAGQKLRPDHFHILSLVCRLVARLANFDEVMHYDQKALAREFFKVALQSTSGPNRQLAGSEMQHPFPIPAYLKKALLPLMTVLPLDKADTKAFGQLSMVLNMPGTWSRFIEPLQRITQVHPEGVLFVLQAMALLQGGRLAEAEQAIDAALRQPSLIQLGDYSKMFAIGIWHQRMQSASGFRRIFVYLKTASALHELRINKLPLWHQATLAPICIDLKEWDLARMIARNFLKSNPNDRQTIEAVAGIAYQSGMLIEALPLFEKLHATSKGEEAKTYENIIANIRARLQKAAAPHQK